MVVTVHNAKTNLSKYLKDIQSGQEKEIIIKKYNTPIGKIIPYDLENLKPKKKKTIRDLWGKYEGKAWISDDFNDSMEDEFDGPLFPEK